GRRGSAPVIGTGEIGSFSDPLPQALALTAIVITFAVTVLLLALAYRSWLLTHDDEVEDDIGDRDVARAEILAEEIHDQEKAMSDGVMDPTP
ncbi:MAG TPA: NADH-quinone oxidoreductase subunit K, partial [Actinomycetes bacterium]|nr:NADH-quinone oxidoreductase subunit K [Actinomycetes bacterium]